MWRRGPAGGSGRASLGAARRLADASPGCDPFRTMIIDFVICTGIVPD
jgi:hypothetical protein